MHERARLVEFDAAWQGLGPSGQQALELAWQGFCVGNKGVGAVLANPDGEIVYKGRNRMHDQRLSGTLSGSSIAHAEIDVLSHLAPGEYSDWTLTTTLQPCPMCASALALSSIGTVRYLAADPLASGVETLSGHVRCLARDWPRIEGPETSPMAEFSMLLSVYHATRLRPMGSLVRAFSEAHPLLVDYATERWSPDTEMGVECAVRNSWNELAQIRQGAYGSTSTTTGT